MRPYLDSATHFHGYTPDEVSKPAFNRHFRRAFASSGGSSAQSAQQALAQNLAIRQNILANAIPVIQNVRSGNIPTYTPGQPSTWTVLASNVGLIRRFWLELNVTVSTAATGQTLTLTPLGLANLLSNVTFIDQNNRQRINTVGAHLHLAASQKRRRPFGGALSNAQGTNAMSGTAGFPTFVVAGGSDAAFGVNYPVQIASPVAIDNTSWTYTFIYEIPVVNSNQDLTGAIYANQTTSNNQLQFTLNPNVFCPFQTDPFYSVWTVAEAISTSAPTLSGTWTLYQDFLDQLPVDNTGFAQLPPIDIAYALCYQWINPGAIVQGQDNLYPLPPFNVYQDLMLFWDNYAAGSYATAAIPPGADTNYVKVQIANTYILAQHDPLELAVRTRNLMGSDFPAFASQTEYKPCGAVYDLDFRHKPLSVNQLSSTNIVFNPKTINNAGSQSLQIGQEYIWYANQAAA